MLFDHAGVPWPYVVAAVLLGVALAALSGSGFLEREGLATELP